MANKEVKTLKNIILKTIFENEDENYNYVNTDLFHKLLLTDILDIVMNKEFRRNKYALILSELSIKEWNDKTQKQPTIKNGISLLHIYLNEQEMMIDNRDWESNLCTLYSHGEQLLVAVEEGCKVKLGYDEMPQTDKFYVYKGIKFIFLKSPIPIKHIADGVHEVAIINKNTDSIRFLLVYMMLDFRCERVIRFGPFVALNRMYGNATSLYNYLNVSQHSHLDVSNLLKNAIEL